MSDMQGPRVKRLWGKIRSTMADVVAETAACKALTPIDTLAHVKTLVDACTTQLDRSPYAVERSFLLQAVELAGLPAGKPRAKYVKYFYELGHRYSDRWQLNPNLVREKGALETGRYREDLGFWFRTNQPWSEAAYTCLWPRHAKRDPWNPDPVRRPYLAAIALASETVQEIRFLNDIVTQAFDTAAIAPVDVDDQLVSITEQLLGAAEVREKIGAQPMGDTAEIIHARQLWQRQTRELDEAVWTPALARIAALIAYRDKLHAVRIQNDTIERISSSVGIDTALDDLIADSGSDELGSTRIVATTADLQHAQVARSKAIAEVRGDYLNALRP
ncbi:hypothetical protein [Rhodococcus sp. 27YEA6]|uniref:hypothetical protein n=1 Tax=Rhodococcus sp. 27YEA6 TaxID=3156273 RepID=UPI0038397CC2